MLLIASRWDPIVSFSQFLTRFIWPIQYAVNLPNQILEIAQPIINKQESLVSENSSLQREHIYLQAQVQKLRALEAENYELRELLQSVSQNKESFSEGRLIHTDVDPFMQQILLNKGKRHNIEVGQPVIDAYGLVGLVYKLNEYTSSILLVTDPSFAVPIQSVRSGERAIAVGSGPGGELRLNYVPRTADFIEGDVLVTSGLGGRFPAGYPVGVITSIQHDTSTRFTLIGISPSAKLGQLRHVLFVKHNPQLEVELAKNDEIESELQQPVSKQEMVQSNTPVKTEPTSATVVQPTPSDHDHEEAPKSDESDQEQTE